MLLCVFLQTFCCTHLFGLVQTLEELWKELRFVRVLCDPYSYFVPELFEWIIWQVLASFSLVQIEGNNLIIDCIAFWTVVNLVAYKGSY